ncbi:MAG: class I SAM-dependent methyltransferase [Candidatus Aenigmarchaeota archaeon]|nr:class I SAM-dependent methyltransferase [Candidatus Aenigmarchaeota archaeon]
MASKADPWDKYYKKDKTTVNIIEKINKLYFSVVFEHYFKQYTPKIKDTKILEAACGSGLMSSRLSKQGADTYLLDFSAYALKDAGKNFKNNKQMFLGTKADIMKMPFNDNTFDIVWNQGVIEHFDKPEKVVKEMMRITKKGGVLIIFIPAYLSPLHIIYNILLTTKTINLWPFDKQKFFKTKELRDIAKDLGYSKFVARRLPRTLGLSSALILKK